MLLFKPAVTALFFATLLVTFALRVHAEESQDASVSVRGLVVSSGQELLINDGVRDFVLLGVDSLDYEGKICEASGVIVILDGVPTIKVRTVTIIADEYSEEDLVGENGRHGNSCLKRCSNGIQGDSMESPGVAMPRLHTLSLHQQGRSGMRLPGHNMAAVCRSLNTDMTQGRLWT